MSPWETVSPTSGLAIREILRGAFSGLSCSPPTSPLCRESWISLGSGITSTLMTLSYTRKCDPLTQVSCSRSPIALALWLTGFFRTDSSDRVQSLSIGGDSIAVKDKLKILGFHLDPLLSMDDHVKETVRACNYHIRALRHVRKSLTLEATRTIVHSLVTAHLDYCISLLLGTTRSNIAKLQHVQCDLARVVLQAPWRTSSKPLLEKLHWLPIQERVIFKVAVIMFMTRSSRQPEYLSEIICDYEQTRNLRSEGQHLLHVPFLKSASARRAFCYAAPKIWNSLTFDTKNATSLGIFRSKLKTELFTSVYK